MKIGLALPALGFRGGLERYTFEIGRSLAAQGHEVVLFHGPEEGRDAQAFGAPFSAVVPLTRARTRPVDVVYVQKATNVEELEVFSDMPVVLAAHDHDHTCARAHRYLPVSHAPCHRGPGLHCAMFGCAVVRQSGPIPVRLVDPLALRRRARQLAERAPIVACSDYVAARLRDAGVPAARVVTVHRVLPWTPEPIVPRPAARRVLVTGQLIRGKGFDIAIHALAYLPRDVVLEIVGHGAQERELKALAAEVAPGRVRFSGYVSPEQMNDVYDRASVVLVPSRWPEPFGMVGLEAMRRGRPVVGARHGGIPEWLCRGAGHLVTPLDPRELAVAALDLLEDSAAGERAREAAAHFSHGATIDALLRVLSHRANWGAPSRPGN